MRFPLRSVRRLLALAFSCWVIAVPLTSFARDAALCRHLAMHEGMPPDDRSGAPCWCSDMTGNTTPIAAETPSLPADNILLPAGAVPRQAIAMPFTGSHPPSPSYAPTPPPPNERNG
jgi:hypothetical protein